jgi:hypothetical protein
MRWHDLGDYPVKANSWMSNFVFSVTMYMIGSSLSEEARRIVSSPLC